MLSRLRVPASRATRPRTAYICWACLGRKSRSLAADRSPYAQIRNGTQRARNHSTSATEEPSNATTVPFRQKFKEEAKQRNRLAADDSSTSTIDTTKKAKSSSSKNSKAADPRLDKWELVVGIEVHAELNTACKLFSDTTTPSSTFASAAAVGVLANAHVGLFDAAFPGAQPRFQQETLLPALRAAIAFNCEIQQRSTFDRKHYFYQDQPAGYQITQYYEPFARDGHIVLYDHDGIAPEDGKSITIGIKQIQMEQDTAKTIQQPPITYLLDLNRTSHPLVEIITLPQIHHPATAAACVRKIQKILKAVNAVTAGMEMGGLRADVNVSVRQRQKQHHTSGHDLSHSYHGVGGLGQRTEIKNLSSFKAVEDAIIAERNRQIDILEAGGVIEGETRGWSLGSTETRRLRGKEGEIDYRYMPDPDIAPVIIGQDLIDKLRETLPQLPDDLTTLLTTSPQYCLTMKDAKTLIALDDGERVDYYFEVVDILEKMPSLRERPNLTPKIGKTAANWVLHELGGLFTTLDLPYTPNTVPAPQLASIIHHTLLGHITGRTAKQLLFHIFNDSGDDGRSVDTIIEQDKLRLVPMSDEEYVVLAQKVMDAHPDMVEAVREGGKGEGKGKAKGKGQMGKVMWFVGRMVQGGEEGRVEAKRAEGVLKRLLKVDCGSGGRKGDLF